MFLTDASLILFFFSRISGRDIAIAMHSQGNSLQAAFVPKQPDVNICCLNATGFSDKILLYKGGILMLNENMKALRKAKGLSQEELAIKLNVVRQTVSKWEKGLSVPDAGMLIQIAEILDTTVNVLLGEEVTVSEEPDLTKTLAAKLEVLNEQYSKQKEHHCKIWSIVFTVVLIVSTVSLIRYLLFFASIYQMKNTGDVSASVSVTVIGGADAPASLPIWYSLWYYLSVLKPVLLSALAAVASAVGLYRIRNQK